MVGREELQHGIKNVDSQQYVWVLSSEGYLNGKAIGTCIKCSWHPSLKISRFGQKEFDNSESESYLIVTKIEVCSLHEKLTKIQTKRFFLFFFYQLWEAVMPRVSIPRSRRRRRRSPRRRRRRRQRRRSASSGGCRRHRRWCRRWRQDRPNLLTN